MRTVFWLLLTATLVACATENLYEGFRAREAMRDPRAPYGAASGLPSYHDYEAERNKLLDPNRRVSSE